jgi:hypothetical protein
MQSLCVLPLAKLAHTRRDPLMFGLLQLCRPFRLQVPGNIGKQKRAEKKYIDRQPVRTVHLFPQNGIKIRAI